MTPQKETKREPRKLKKTSWHRQIKPLDCILRDMRIAKNLKLIEVGKATGIDIATIARIEHGFDCSLSRAIKLAEFYGATVDNVWHIEKPAKELSHER